MWEVEGTLIKQRWLVLSTEKKGTPIFQFSTGTSCPCLSRTVVLCQVHDEDRIANTKKKRLRLHVSRSSFVCASREISWLRHKEVIS